jgi:hypothetical protein
MIDICIISMALLLFFMGKGNQAARGLLLGGLVVSSAIASIVVYLDVIADLDPQIFGINCFIALVLSLFAYKIESERKVELMASFVVLAAYNYFTYVEYYTGSSAFYTFYGPVMIMITIWQMVLMTRLGNVELYFGVWIMGDNSIGSDGCDTGASRISASGTNELRAGRLS